MRRIASTDKKEVKRNGNQKAMLVVSFGTSYEDTRKATIEACERKIDKAFSAYEVRRAFTSNMIIKKLKERDNMVVDTPEQALVKLREEGFSEVIVQSLHILNGAEYHDLEAEVAKFEGSFDRLVIGKPLLTGVDDYLNAAEALKNQMPSLADNEAVVWMGHGTYHFANAAYACLDYVFEDIGMKNTFVGTVEGYPELDSVIKKLKKHRIEKVTLMPLMLVAGDHAQNDMAGDEEDSWKVVLEKQGFAVDVYMHGLGENEGIQEMYMSHAKAAVEGQTGY
ncbi:MAG: sirohydrochlorin cobaltochelatase [Firmicutes bacterium]|nr:sirohydrochlorin cobaltochelatase [Bacillota bacterium]